MLEETVEVFRYLMARVRRLLKIVLTLTAVLRRGVRFASDVHL